MPPHCSFAIIKGGGAFMEKRIASLKIKYYEYLGGDEFCAEKWVIDRTRESITVSTSRPDGICAETTIRLPGVISPMFEDYDDDDSFTQMDGAATTERDDENYERYKISIIFEDGEKKVLEFRTDGPVPLDWISLCEDIAELIDESGIFSAFLDMGERNFEEEDDGGNEECGDEEFYDVGLPKHLYCCVGLGFKNEEGRYPYTEWYRYDEEGEIAVGTLVSVPIDEDGDQRLGIVVDMEYRDYIDKEIDEITRIVDPAKENPALVGNDMIERTIKLEDPEEVGSSLITRLEQGGELLLAIETPKGHGHGGDYTLDDFPKDALFQPRIVVEDENPNEPLIPVFTTPREIWEGRASSSILALSIDTLIQTMANGGFGDVPIVINPFTIGGSFKVTKEFLKSYVLA